MVYLRKRGDTDGSAPILGAHTLPLKPRKGDTE